MELDTEKMKEKMREKGIGEEEIATMLIDTVNFIEHAHDKLLMPELERKAGLDVLVAFISTRMIKEFSDHSGVPLEGVALACGSAGRGLMSGKILVGDISFLSVICKFILEMGQAAPDVDKPKALLIMEKWCDETLELAITNTGDTEQ